MAGYTKLFSSIVTSTIWRERDHVRLVWVTMLAMSDQHGVIESSVPGLADMARVSRELCDDALDVLSSPDVDSRTKDNDGRRIMAVDGGWKLINHAKYREKMSLDEKRNRNAAYMRDYRSRNESVSESKVSVNDRKPALAPVGQVEHAEASPEAEADQKKPDMPLQKRRAYPEAFEAVWAGTGQRGGKSAAFKAWTKSGSIAWGELALTWNAYMLSERVKKGFVKDLSGWFNGGYHEKDWAVEATKPQAAFIDWDHMRGVAPARDIRGADYCVWHQRHQNDGTVSRYPKSSCPGCKIVADAESERAHAASVAKILAERARRAQ